MQKFIEDTNYILNKPYEYLYSASIAKQVATEGGNSSGILIIGMVVLIVGIIGFIITKNKN